MKLKKNKKMKTKTKKRIKKKNMHTYMHIFFLERILLNFKFKIKRAVIISYSCKKYYY